MSTTKILKLFFDHTRQKQKNSRSTFNRAVPKKKSKSVVSIYKTILT